MGNPFELRVEPVDAGRCVVAVSGDLDIATAAHVRRAVQRAGRDGYRLVVVDLREAESLDSSGLAALQAGIRRMRSLGGDLVLVSTDPVLARMFELVRFERVTAIHASLDEALAGAGGGGRIAEEG